MHITSLIKLQVQIFTKPIVQSNNVIYLIKTENKMSISKDAGKKACNKI